MIGQLAFALKGQVPIVQLDEPLRYVHLPPLDARTRSCPALYVELERRHDPSLVQAQFASASNLGTRERRYGDVPLARYTVLLLAGPRP